ncbi:hypothetical protein, partial [Ruegeria sp. Ofav3-42]|uniref:hypothetical protein n=1 Tax=Ruegeria sp. Ofav3-42 TaxID=2917759 RepID=UPI001EF6823D
SDDAEISQPRARTLREWQRPSEVDNPIGTSLAEFIKASGDNADTQTGRTDEGTDKIPANITRKLLQCRSHPQKPFTAT